MAYIIVLSGVYFTVGLSTYTEFLEQEIIKFDKVITNIGGGYIDDDNHADYGKFITPQNGTYQFNANLYNKDKVIGADLRVNSGRAVIATRNAGSGTTSFSAILDLKENEEVYLTRPEWVSDYTEYDKYFTSFSGFLIRLDA